jgi:hypothetical protein
MLEFRTYKYGDNVDYVMFNDENTRKGEAEMSCISLLDGEWYIGYAIWSMDTVPETTEEYYELQIKDGNEFAGWGEGSWKSLDEIEEADMLAEHVRLIKYIKEGK